MRVVYDSRPAREFSGIGRYARCLLAALRETARGELVESDAPRRCDVFHSPWIDGAPLRSPVPSVVTLHDLIPLKRRSEYLRLGLRFKLRYLAVQRAAHVIVPTEAVAADARERLRLVPERITVIPEAVDPGLGPRSAEEIAAVRKKYDLPEQYLLWVGNMRTPDPRKRVAALVKARRELPLVLAGPASRWSRELDGPGVTVTGAVDDDELAALYSGAHAFVFPSDDEGFGLPPLEALACGTPVFAFDVPAIREVLDGRATFADVGDMEGLVSAAEAAVGSPPPPPAWSWQDAAQRTWDVYETALRDGATMVAARSRRERAAPGLEG